MKRYWGTEVKPHAFLTSALDKRRVNTFTPRPLYPGGRNPWYPLDRRLGGPQSRSGRGEAEKNFPSPCRGEKKHGRPAQSPDAIPTELSRLPPCDKDQMETQEGIARFSVFRTKNSLGLLAECTHIP